MTDTTATRAGSWERIAAGHYVYRNASGTALAYVQKYRGGWESEVREGARFVETKVRARTMRDAMAETEEVYRASREDTTTEQHTEETEMRLNVNDYLNAEDDAVSQDLFASQYTSRQLAYALADEISLRSDNAERVAFLAEYNAGPMLGWIRGNITRALSAHGVTVQMLNRRKS